MNAPLTFRDETLEGEPPLAVRDYGGSGPAILLVHGVMRTLEDWSLLAPLLRREHRVLAMDLRGHGRSGDGGWSWTDVLADLERVARHLELGRPAVIGHSLGGLIATLYAAHHPDCPGAVNIDGYTWLPPDRYPGLSPELAQAHIEQLKASMLQQASAMDTPLSEAAFRAAIAAQQPLAEQLGVPFESLAASAERASVRDAQGNYRSRPSGEALSAIHETTNALDLPQLYHQVKCPLLVFGLSAPMTPEAYPGPSWLPEFLGSFQEGRLRELQALALGQPNVEVEVLEAPHIAPLSHPRQLASRIGAFLAAHPASSSSTCAPTSP